jgi:hypothetical protein
MGALRQDGLADETVGRNITLTLTLTLILKHPCGGGVEYLHLDPASRRRRRKGKSQIWDSKIWSRVPRETTLARASSIYKRQIHPLVKEGAPQKQDRNCQRVINIWSWAPYWLTDRQSQCDFDFDSAVALAKPAAIVNDRPILSSDRMLYKDYNRKCLFRK